MSEIKIYSLDENNAEDVKGLMLEEPHEALKKGLPIAALGAVMDGSMVGTVAGAAAAGVFEIDSVFVEPSFRRQGAGTALIEKLSEYTDEMDLGLKVEYTLQNDDNKTLAPFFEALDFVEDPVEYPMYCLGRLENLNVNVRASQMKYDSIQSFFNISEKMLKSATLRSFSSGWPLPEGGLTSQKTDKEMSFCSVKGDRISAYVVVEPMGEDMIRIPALWSELNDPREMMVMLGHAIDMMRRHFRGTARVAMLALNPVSYRIIEHICDGVELCSFRYIRKD